MAGKFLFCMPLRLGAFFITLWQILTTGAAAAFLWFGVIGMSKQPDAPTKFIIEFAILGGVFTLGTIFSFIGMLGVFTKSRKIISFFAGFQGLELAVVITSSIFVLVTVFAKHGLAVQACEGKKDGIESTQLACADLLNDLDSQRGKIWAAVTISLSILSHIFNIYTLRQYRRELAENEDDDRIPLSLSRGYTRDFDEGMRESKDYLPHAKYDPPPTARANPSQDYKYDAQATPRASMAEDRESMLHPNLSYPYGDANHS